MADVGNRTDKTSAIGTVQVYSMQTVQRWSDGEDGVDGRAVARLVVEDGQGEASSRAK